MRFNIANMVSNTVSTFRIGLIFMLDASDQILIQARPIYQETMEKSKKMVAEAIKTEDWQSIRSQMEEVMSKHKSSIKHLLSQEQMSKLEKYEKERKRQRRQNRNWEGDRWAKNRRD